MATYQAIYKCRLCGKVRKDYFPPEFCKGIIQGMMAEKALDDGMELPLRDRCHKCGNGDIGVMEFQGFRMVE